jgi:hypothetical protein
VPTPEEARILLLTQAYLRALDGDRPPANRVISVAKAAKGLRLRRVDALQILSGQLVLGETPVFLISGSPIAGGTAAESSPSGSPIAPATAGGTGSRPASPRVSPPAPPVSDTPTPLERESTPERSRAWKFSRWLFETAVAAGVIPRHRTLDPRLVDREILNDAELAEPLMTYTASELEERARRMIALIKAKKLRRAANCRTLFEVWDWGMLDTAPVPESNRFGSIFREDEK